MSTGKFDAILGEYREDDTTDISGKLNLDQTTPQTLNLAGNTGLMKLTAGVLGLDTSTYITDITGKVNLALDNLASVAMNADLQWNNTAARTLNIAPSATDVVGRALTIVPGSAVAGTAVNNRAGGSLYIQSGLGTGSSTSAILFQTPVKGTTGKVLQTTYATHLSINSAGNSTFNTNGQDCILSTFYPTATGSDGHNIWIGGGGQKSVNPAGSTWIASNNVSLGFATLVENTTGFLNTCVGGYIMQFSTTAFNNTAMGYSSLNGIDSGANNAAYGYSSLIGLYSGNYNLGFGAFTLTGVSTTDGNIGIGAFAGSYKIAYANLMTEPVGGTYIGAYSVGLADGEVNATVIGGYAEGLGSNTVVLGNDDVILTALKGQVGIGTTAPDVHAKLDVVSTTQGFLPPRLTTTQRDAISTPTAGLIIYNSTTNKLNLFTTTWEVITSA